MIYRGQTFYITHSRWLCKPAFNVFFETSQCGKLWAPASDDPLDAVQLLVIYTSLEIGNFERHGPSPAYSQCKMLVAKPMSFAVHHCCALGHPAARGRSLEVGTQKFSWGSHLYITILSIPDKISLPAIIYVLVMLSYWYILWLMAFWLSVLFLKNCREKFLSVEYPIRNISQSFIGNGFITTILGSFIIWKGGRRELRAILTDVVPNNVPHFKRCQMPWKTDD